MAGLAAESRNSRATTQGFRRESRPFGKRGKLRPADFGVHPSAHAAIGAAHHILPPDNASPVDEASRDEFGMLHDVRGMTDHARHQDRAGCELSRSPDIHLVLMPHVRRLERVGLRLNLEGDVDNVFDRYVIDMRAVPAAPAPVVAHVLGGMPASAWFSTSIR